MKYLLLLILLAVVAFMLGVKRARPPASRRSKAEPPAAPGPQQMVSCLQCGLHLPSDEALPGRGGMFCGAAHRAAYEAEHGGPA